jgi:transposase-like protein
MKSNRKSERRERREFSAEFQAEAVRLVAERRAAGATLAQVGRELDVRPDQLRAWARQQRDANGVRSALPGETIEQENRRLRHEVATLRQEQAFAKKVATGSTDQCNTAASFAAGVMKPKVLRGRVFSLSAIASN